MIGRQYEYDSVHGQVTIHDAANITVVPIQTGLVFLSASSYGYVIAYDETAGGYTANGAPDVPLLGVTTGDPATLPLMTAPQIFTVGRQLLLL